MLAITIHTEYMKIARLMLLNGHFNSNDVHIHPEGASKNPDMIKNFWQVSKDSDTSFNMGTYGIFLMFLEYSEKKCHIW